jgi:ribosomal protein S18 acetylase RimI-like enzyme
MTASVEYLLNQASAPEIAELLSRCDADFVPPLSGRVKIDDYAKKIASKSTRFEAWSDDKLVGLVAAYCNDQERHVAYITSVSVLREWTGKGIATHLINQCVEQAKTVGMRKIRLEVASNNSLAIKLYEKSGFVVSGSKESFVSMIRFLANGELNEE